MSSAASAAAHAVPPPGPNILRRNSGRCTAPRSTPGSAVLEEIQLVGLASRHPPDRVSPNNDDDDDGHSTQDSQQLQLPLAPPHESRASLTNMSSITRLSVYYYNLFLKGLSYNSFVLENANNLARDHLSNERTWLAYIRTSLLLAATGVGMVQFFVMTMGSTLSPEASATFLGLSTTLERFARPFGETTVILALCLMLIGVHRYFTIQRSILRGRFPAARMLVVLLSTSVAILVVVICGVFLTLP